MNAYNNLLDESGYVFADQVKDFGSVLTGVSYFVRTTENIHEYVQVIFYEDTFCEAVYELYMAPKNTMKFKGNSTVDAVRRGYQSLSANIVRSLSELDKLACRTRIGVLEESGIQMTALEQAEKADRNRRK